MSDPTAGTPRTDLRADDCGILIGKGPRRCNDKAGHATPYHSWFGEPVVTRIEAEASGTGLDVFECRDCWRYITAHHPDRAALSPVPVPPETDR